MIGHAPINKNDGGSHGIKPKRLNIETSPKKWISIKDIDPSATLPPCSEMNEGLTHPYPLTDYNCRADDLDSWSLVQKQAKKFPEFHNLEVLEVV
mgnify:CR=1 FL=1